MLRDYDFLYKTEDPFPEIKDGTIKNKLLHIQESLEKLMEEEYELKRKLEANLSAQAGLEQAIKWGIEAYKNDARLDRDLEESKKAAAGMLKLLVSDKASEFFGDLDRGREYREKPTAGLS